MRRMWAIIALPALLGLLSLPKEKESAAQTAAASLPSGMFGQSARESEALSFAEDGKLLTARRLADEILAQDPNSIAAHYIVGRTLFVEEGSLPNALYHLKRALALYEARYPVPSNGEEAPWRLHSRILLNIAWVAGDMEDYEEQFWALDQSDLYYVPKRTVDRAWPLMKMRRFDEARAMAQTGIDAEAEWQKSSGYNAMCAISGEARDRQRGYDDCLLAYQKSLARYQRDPSSSDFAGDVVVDGHNAAWGAQGLLKFEETERYLLKASEMKVSTGTNPWQGLAELYTEQGRFIEAVSALQQMQSWRNQSPPSARDQRRASLEQTLSLVLLVSGEANLGLRVITRAIEHPDRRATTSSDAAQALGGSALLRRALTRIAAERLAEDASAEGLLRGAVTKLQSQWRSAQAIADEERVVGVLTDEERLISTFRPYLAGGLDAPVWLLGDLIPIVGPGIAQATLQEARALETLPELTPYYDALEAEVALAQTDYSEALRLSQSALSALPQKQKLMRARASAVGALSAWKLGQSSEALSLYTQALQEDPGVLRRFGAALPVRIEDQSQSPLSKEISSRLARSPRLEVGSEGFVVSISAEGESARMCLETPQGAQLACAESKAPEKDQPAPTDDAAARAIKAFHQRAFAPLLGDVAADLRSLDGSPASANENMRQKTKSILEEMSK